MMYIVYLILGSININKDLTFKSQKIRYNNSGKEKKLYYFLNYKIKYHK